MVEDENQDDRRLDRDKLLAFFDGLSDEDKEKYFEESSLSPVNKDKTRVVTTDGKVFAIKQDVFDNELQGKDGEENQKKIEALLEGDGKVLIIDPATKSNEYYIVDENLVDSVKAQDDADDNDDNNALYSPKPDDVEDEDLIEVKNAAGESLYIKKADVEECRGVNTEEEKPKCEKIKQLVKIGQDPTETSKD